METLKRYFIKFLMFISSYFPLYVILLILNYEEFDSFYELKDKNVAIFVAAMTLCILISIVSLIFLKISDGDKPLKIDEIDRPDDTIISYMITYIIPILTTNFLDKGEIIVNVILFLLIGYMYIRLNLLYLNPLWSIFGYLPYRINNDVIIITNIEYAKLKIYKKNNININVKGFYIANDIFVAQKRSNKI